MHNPQICFLDEPSKSLDPITARRVRGFLRDYARDHGMTICLTTHNMLEAEEVCDRLALINYGKLRFIGTPLSSSAMPLLRRQSRLVSTTFRNGLKTVS